MEAVEDPAAPRRLLSRVPAEDEARAALATEVFSAVVGLVQPQLDAYSAQVISPIPPYTSLYLPVSPCISPYLQVGLISVLTLPLFEEWADFLGGASGELGVGVGVRARVRVRAHAP